MAALNDDQIKLLREACQHPVGEVRAKVAGKVHLAAAEARRVEAGKALQLFGFFDSFGQDGAYLVWRLKPKVLGPCREELARRPPKDDQPEG